MAELKIMGMVLCRVVAANDLTAEERGQKLAARLSPMFDGTRPLLNFEVKVVKDRSVIVRDSGRPDGGGRAGARANLSRSLGQDDGGHNLASLLQPPERGMISRGGD